MNAADLLGLAAAGAVAFGCWWVSLRWWPYTACWKCSGTGKNTGSNRQRWGDCRKCGGSGKRLRWGARP
jgi:DnaJ-class molecular chaperone